MNTIVLKINENQLSKKLVFLLNYSNRETFESQSIN